MIKWKLMQHCTLLERSGWKGNRHRDLTLVETLRAKMMWRNYVQGTCHMWWHDQIMFMPRLMVPAYLIGVVDLQTENCIFDETNIIHKQCCFQTALWAYHCI